MEEMSIGERAAQVLENVEAADDAHIEFGKMIRTLEYSDILIRSANKIDYETLSAFKAAAHYKKIKRFGTWKKFCNDALGQSEKTVDEKLKNFRIFGSAFLEIAGDAGLRRNDIRQLSAAAQDGEIEISDGRVYYRGEAVEIDKDKPEPLINILSIILDRESAARQAERDAKREAKDALEKQEKKYERLAAGTEAEYRKELEAVSKERDKYRALAPNADDIDEWAAAIIAKIKKAVRTIELDSEAFIEHSHEHLTPLRASKVGVELETLASEASAALAVVATGLAKAFRLEV